MRPTLIILFGLPGVGKTAAGELLARDFGFDFVDADDLMTDKIREQLSDPDSEVAAEAARDAWYGRIVAALAQRIAFSGRVAFAQALIQQKHRDLLRAHFPFAKFVLIEADGAALQQRLADRDHFLPPERAAALRAFFEPVAGAYVVVDNSGDVADLRVRLAAVVEGVG